MKKTGEIITETQLVNHLKEQIDAADLDQLSDLGGRMCGGKITPLFDTEGDYHYTLLFVPDEDYCDAFGELEDPEPEILEETPQD